jgi:predicted phosphate transport protein (TIGR00153 family)
MGFSLAPREERFFDMFEESVEVVLEGAKLFNALLLDYTDIELKAKKIKEIELKGDQNTHRLVEALNRSFVTPIDRDDIYSLNSELDDLLDYVEAIASRLILFKVKETTPEMRQFGELILQSAEQISKAVHNLRKMDHLMSFCKEIKRLENLGDDLSRKAISDLFEKCTDPIELIKMKEIYGRLESTMDKCEDIANTIETIVVKNG